MKKLKATLATLAVSATLVLGAAVPANAATGAEIHYVYGGGGSAPGLMRLDKTNSYRVTNVGTETEQFVVRTSDGEVVVTPALAPGATYLAEFPRDYPETVTVANTAGTVLDASFASRYDVINHRCYDTLTRQYVAASRAQEEGAWR